MKKKLLSLFLILSISSFLLTGCYDARGIETLAYALAIGIDEGENNILTLSVQFANPSSLGGEGGGSSSQSKTTTISTVECASINSGLNTINSYISKRINLSHCKVIIISESLASKGISEHIYTLINNMEIRPNCSIIISRCTAKDFLDNAKPSSETLTARYYESVLKSTQYTGYTEDMELMDFYSAFKSTTSQAYAVLASVNVPATQLKNTSTDKINIDASYEADETPIKDETSLQSMGLAVFKDDKLVGELNGLESICHLIVTNKMENCMITIPSPFEPNGIINLQLQLAKNTQNNVNVSNGSPLISCSVYLEGNIISSSNNVDYSSKENLELIQRYANAYIEGLISQYLYKTSKEFQSDIVGFGKYIRDGYLTWEDWEKYDWLSKYQNSFFDVTVKTNVKTGELFLRY